jgi:hypothetical protein
MFHKTPHGPTFAHYSAGYDPQNRVSKKKLAEGREPLKHPTDVGFESSLTLTAMSFCDKLFASRAVATSDQAASSLAKFKCK